MLVWDVTFDPLHGPISFHPNRPTQSLGKTLESKKCLLNASRFHIYTMEPRAEVEGHIGTLHSVLGGTSIE